MSIDLTQAGPVRYKVRAHKRLGKLVKSYQRGKGKSKRVLCDCGCGKFFKSKRAVTMHKIQKGKRPVCAGWNKGETKFSNPRIAQGGRKQSLTKRKNGTWNLGETKHTHPGIMKQSLKLTSRPKTQEHRDNISKALIGREFSPEWRSNMSEAAKKRPPRPRGPANHSWKGGATGKHRELRAKTIARYDGKCALCGKRRKKYMQMHHIDKNKENNSSENLILLCIRCHRMITEVGCKVNSTNLDLFLKLLGGLM